MGTLIETNREKWNEGNIQDYDYIYNRTLGTTLQVDVEVFVRQGAVDSVAVEGEPVSDTAGYLTIDDAFVRLTAAFERDTGGTFVVTFNNEYGYPREFVAGPSDDGSPGEDFFIQEFEPRN
ncbi:MAG: hypothetical protein GVY25_07460 [Bacteroidetes bacterium]|nr:hypothetical protein [Bacteroidota bacterium]